MSKTRPRGFAPWSTRFETRILLGQITAVLEEYADHLPLTCRQVFYRVVGAHGYDKTERAYSRLREMLGRAGYVRFESIRDDGMTRLEPSAWDSTDDFSARQNFSGGTDRKGSRCVCGYLLRHQVWPR